MSSSHFPFLLILLLIEGILTSNHELGIRAVVPSVFPCCVALTTKQISCRRHFGIQLSVSLFGCVVVSYAWLNLSSLFLMFAGKQNVAI
jgi:hypothetical protein